MREFVEETALDLIEMYQDYGFWGCLRKAAVGLLLTASGVALFFAGCLL